MKVVGSIMSIQILSCPVNDFAVLEPSNAPIVKVKLEPASTLVAPPAAVKTKWSVAAMAALTEGLIISDDKNIAEIDMHENTRLMIKFIFDIFFVYLLV